MQNKMIFFATIMLALFLMACSLLNQFHPPGDVIKTVLPSPVPSNTKATQVCTVIVDHLNLRSGPGTSWGAVAILSNGDIVTILSEPEPGINWVNVRAHGLEGWINQLYCKETR